MPCLHRRFDLSRASRPFSLPGEHYTETWLRGTAGVKYTVGKGVFVVSLNGTTQSEAANA